MAGESVVNGCVYSPPVGSMDPPEGKPEGR